MNKSLSSTAMTLWFLGALFIAGYAHLQSARPEQLAFYDVPSGHDIIPAMGRYAQSDPIGLAGTSPGTLSTYAYVGSNPLRAIDPFGLDTYVANRDLSALGSNDKPRWDLFTHTFTFITNPDGSINATYSWGNDANLRGWNLNQPLDISTARQALADGRAEWIAGPSLDPYVGQAFNELNNPPFEHANGWFWYNCKTEKNNLLAEAKRLQALGELHPALPLMSPVPQLSYPRE
jgi:hypothetical protein